MTRKLESLRQLDVHKNMVILFTFSDNG